jgi:IS4 transposase
LKKWGKSSEYYQIQKFYNKTERFGTIAILSNIDTENAEHFYTSYKSRNNIEVMFDGIKSVLLKYPN